MLLGHRGSTRVPSTLHLSIRTLAWVLSCCTHTSRGPAQEAACLESWHPGSAMS